MTRALPPSQLDDDLSAEWSAFNVDDDGFDLFRAAAMIARVEYPDLDADAVSHEVDLIASRVLARMGSVTWPEPLVALVREMFSDPDGFKGDRKTYDAPENSFIHRVLKRRRGLPIALSVLTCEVARRAGIDAYGIAFPGHFLVGVRHEGDEGEAGFWILDPFEGGRLRTTEDLEAQLHRTVSPGVQLDPEHLAPANPRAILERMLNNLRATYARRRDPERLVAVLSRLLILHPGRESLLLERGRARRVILEAEGARQDALAVLERGGERAMDAAALLDQLERDRILH